MPNEKNGITVKSLLRPSSDCQHGIIYYCISCRRRSKMFSSHIRLHTSLWDGSAPCVASVRDRVEADLSRIRHIAENSCDRHDLGEIVKVFRSRQGEMSLKEYISCCINHLTHDGRFGTGRNYRAALRSIEKYMGDADPALCDINTQWVHQYREWLATRNKSLNTISFHMRVLKAVLHKASSQGLIANADYFNGISTGNAATKKRAVTTDTIHKLSTLDLSRKPEMDLARDIFLFSIMTRGMSFVDIAFLRNENVCDGYLTYRRRKTRRLMTIRVEPQAAAIIAKYNSVNREWLFPILANTEYSQDTKTGNGLKEYSDIETADKEIYDNYVRAIDTYNRRLLRLGKLIGLETRLTSYVARHTWATLVHKKNVPVSVISAALGHTSERTTVIYLADIDNREVDTANRLLLDDLF